MNVSGKIRIKGNIPQLSRPLGRMYYLWKDIAVILGVSVRTLQRRAKEWNISKYNRISNADIDNTVREILQEFPTAGEVMLAGHITARQLCIKRQRIRDSIHRIRGQSSCSQRIQRRVYSVPGPNYLWHADGHHKLIKYRLVIHGRIFSTDNLPKML